MKNLKIHEVGLRDGLQNEKIIVPSEIKIKWIEKLIDSGIDIIQLGSFVHQEKVPQMADTDFLFEYFTDKNYKIIFSGLILNERGMERAIKSGVEMFCMGVSASNTHSMKNTGMSTNEAITRIIKIATELQNSGKKVQVSIQSAFGCGFEGKIDEAVVLNIVRKYVNSGLLNISLADTAGHAYPEQVKRLFSEIQDIDDDIIMTAHFHNTYGLGIANCYAALNEGAEYFETAFGGLGGCPFTKVAAGNVSSEDFVHSLQRNNMRKDININKILEVSKDAEIVLQKKMESYVFNSGLLSY